MKYLNPHKKIIRYKNSNRGLLEMNGKKIIILMSILFIATLAFKIPSTRAIIRDQTISTIAEKDSYVVSDKATSNFGGGDWLRIGKYNLGWNELYLFFTFSDKPVNWTKAEISLDIPSVSESFNVTVSLINDIWDEYTINWLNKPPHREIITVFTAAEEKIYKIDITDYIEGRENISICLNASNYLQNGWAAGFSKEGAWVSQELPKLIWTYPENAQITVTNPISSSLWEDSNYYTIRWTSQGLIINVIIQLWDGTTFIEVITDTYTENDGEYEFYVSSSENYTGNFYMIKIIDYGDSFVFDYSYYFSINEQQTTDDAGNGDITVSGYNLVIILGITLGISLILIKNRIKFFFN